MIGGVEYLCVYIKTNNEERIGFISNCLGRKLICSVWLTGNILECFEGVSTVICIVLLRALICLLQENRVHMLKREVEHSIKMAELIEYNLEDVDAAILAVRVALASGMSWDDLTLMVKEEKKSGNPVAGLIDKLYLERNCMTLLLSNNLDEMDDDEKTQPVDKVIA